MVDAPDNWPAWLEDASGNRTPIHGSCSLGRAESNQVTLQDDTVSRRHAVIQAQGEQEYWLVDFGSSNGSYVNGQRIAQPTRLRDGATLAIGATQYVFRQPRFTGTVQFETPPSDQTIIDVRWAKCWLLVADIINSSKLVAELPADTLPRVTGQWLAQCKEAIEMHGGCINQFLGDGFFAFWHDHERMGADIDDRLIGSGYRELNRGSESGLPKHVLRRADRESRTVAQARGLSDALSIHVTAVAAAEIHQPVFLFALGLDHRVPT